MNDELRISHEQDGGTITVWVNGRGVGTFYFNRHDKARTSCQRLGQVKTVGDAVQLLTSTLANVLYDHLDDITGDEYPDPCRLKGE